MARQVFSVLVGLLRDEKSHLDFHTWNPASFKMWHVGEDPDEIRDDLDVFYRPLRCLATDCASLDATTHANDTSSIIADVDVTWIPMPLWSSVDEALHVAAAAERASARPFDRILVFVPSAWHLDVVGTAGRSSADGDVAVPLDFWRALAAWQQQSSHAGARFAALTMPLEFLACAGPRQNVTNRLLIQKFRLNQTWVAQKCDHGCCLRSVTASRNLFGGLPSGWHRVDFAALTQASSPRGLVGHNWHYECIYNRPGGGVNFCSRKWVLRTGLRPLCVERLEQHFARTTSFSWIPRSSGDCGEEGNTLLWRHLAHSPWLVGDLAVL